MIARERRLREVLPGAQVYLGGSASLPGLEPGDLDLVAFVDEVAPAADRVVALL